MTPTPAMPPNADPGGRATKSTSARSEERRVGKAVTGVQTCALPSWLREIPAVVILRTVWLTQYHRTITHGRQEVAWREEKDLPPSRQRLCSPYDPDARYATKRGSGWEGYKIHLSAIGRASCRKSGHRSSDVCSSELAAGDPRGRHSPDRVADAVPPHHHPRPAGGGLAGGERPPAQQATPLLAV